MKSLTSKFVLALLSLVLTGAALSVGVYAWFTINNRVSIDAFEGQVEGGEGLLLSVNEGQDWSGFITSTEIQGVITANGFNRFAEMTSVDGYTFTDKAGAPVSGDSGYIWFDVWFLGTEFITGVDVTEVTFTSDGLTKFPTEIVIPGRTELEGHAANAARLSIVELTNEGAIPTADVNVKAFEQFKVNDNTIGKGDYPVDTDGVYTSGNYAVWYYNAVAQTTAALTPINEATFDAAELVSTVERNDSNAENGFEAQEVATNATTITSPIAGQEFTKRFKVRVFVWIEGWDQEAFNAILSGKFSVTLGFEGTTTP